VSTPRFAKRLGERLRRRGLVVRFSVLSLVAVLALGVVLARMIRAQVRDRALANAAQSGELIVRFGLQPQLGQADLSHPLSPEAVAALDALLHAGYTAKPVVSMQVYNRGLQTVYAPEHRLMGRSPQPGDAAPLKAALRGRVTAQVREDIDGRRMPDKVIATFVPLRLVAGSRPAGAFEVYLSYAPVAKAIAHDTWRLYLVLSLGLLALYAALYRIAAGASRQLRTQAADSEHRAHHDGLTGLPNRDHFLERTKAAIASIERGEKRAAVMLLDLDRFKEINDTLGHQSGDVLLIQTGDRLRRALRDTDVLARLGGDEFAVLLPTVEGADGAADVAVRIREALQAPVQLRGLSVHIDASVGIAVFPDHGTDVEELLQRADVAMYAAKGGGPSHCVYSAQHDPYSPERLAMISELREAIDDGSLEVHYQPKADLRTGHVAGVEALVRWRHPERGLIAPDEFIPLAEHTGLITPLTVHVLTAALAQCRAWSDAGIPLDVAVNLSPRNLAEAELPELVARLLAEAGVGPDRLKLEITESSIMADPLRARDVLTRLDAMGVGLAIDDFGTGYSSLSYLSELPVNEIKIDRSFVRNMQTSSGDAFIVRATIDLGRNLGLVVVAEGVEDEEMWARLGELGCDTAQGYFLSRPVPAAELGAWLRAHPERAPERTAT
jgi:diguanylate cyclase (GGDEF)-like protein